MKRLFVFIIYSLISLQIEAQEILISGTVTSANDKYPLAGASIIIKGSTIGTKTDFDGNFKIKVKEKDVLVFEYVGFISKEVIITNQRILEISLEEDYRALEEVVVIGYGTRKKMDVTEVVSAIRSESFHSSLSGKVSGVRISTNDLKSGQLTAGEINDIDNWNEWLEVKQKGVKEKQNDWGFYLENKLTVSVCDTSKKTVNNVKVSVYDSSNNLIMNSMTDITGNAVLFKSFLRKNNDTFFTVQLKHKNKVVGKKVLMKHDKLNFVIGKKDQSNDIDVMFTIDATGSMGDEIAYLKAELKNIMSRINKTIEKKRVALTFYRDHGDDYLVKDFDFNTNIDEVKEALSNQYAGGGGDYEEAVEKALEVSLGKSWNLDSKSKLLFLLLDAPPHFNEKNVSIIKEQIKLAQEKGIKIIPIVASGADKDVEFLMRYFSISTNGTYVFLTDDSGIGNAHLKPSTDDYKVEKLNDLIVRLIEKYSGVMS